MKYIDVPNQINFKNIIEKQSSLSASQYKTIIHKNNNTLTVKDFLERKLSFDDLGNEVGSANYIDKSPYYFVRTKALQSHSYIPEETQESVLPVNPKVFINQNLKAGDIIISKDSNIGEVIILDKDYPNWMLSGALYKLPIKQNKFYLLAFLKHNFFREYLDFIVPKSSTIRHAKTLFLDCKIPIPNKNAENTIQYIEALTQAIIAKEIEIKNKHNQIHNLIETELKQNQKPEKFIYELPRLDQLMDNARMDTSIYTEDFKKKNYLVKNYKFGSIDLISRGFDWARGTSLEMGFIKTRIDSETYIKGFYELIIPTNISTYGTVNKSTFIGTPVKLKTINRGDIIFGGEGFGKGRSFVVCKDVDNIATNYHGIRIINNNKNLIESIFIRCFLSYWRSLGMIDYIGVGGSGGHCAPSYFHFIETPSFPDSKQKEISSLYHNEKAKFENKNTNLENFLTKDKEFNQHAGILELDNSAKQLKEHLNFVINQIINDEEVKTNFEFLLKTIN